MKILSWEEEMSLKIFTLASGVRCALVPSAKAADVGFTVALAGGSRYDDPDRQGLHHLLEHMLSHATARHPTHQDFSAEVERCAQTYNAYTRGSAITLSFTCVPSKLIRCIRLAYQAVCRPRFVEDDFTRQVQTVMGERLVELDNPMHYAMELMGHLAFRGHPLSQSVIGDLGHLEKHSVVDLRRLHRKIVCGHRLAVSVVGQFQPERVLQELRQTFGTLRPGLAANPQPFYNSQRRLRLRCKRQPLRAVYLSLGFPTFGFDHPDRPTLSLLNFILGGQQWQSRLYQRLVVEEALGYHACSTVWHETDTGMLEISCAIRQAKEVSAVQMLTKELRYFQQARLPADILHNAKATYIRETRLRGQGTLASFFAQQLLHLGRFIPNQIFLQSIRDVTAADLQRVATQVFRPERASFAILGRARKLDRARITRTLATLRTP